MTTHELKVVPPYYVALATGVKTFEVRKNDRAYQRGDILKLREWHPAHTSSTNPCPEPDCGHHRHAYGHWADREPLRRRVTFVHAGDPRFGGIEPGYVVLGLSGRTR